MCKNADDLKKNISALKIKGFAEFLPVSLRNVACGEDRGCRVLRETK